MTLRRLVGEAKAIPYGHILVEELQGGGEKYVVIALHIDAMFHLRNFLWGSGIKAQVVYGGTNDKESKAIEDQFQHGDLQVVIWQLKKAIGVTLTAACHVRLARNRLVAGQQRTSHKARTPLDAKADSARTVHHACQKH
jgi:hypothetical protein